MLNKAYGTYAHVPCLENKELAAQILSIHDLTIIHMCLEMELHHNC